ncbi:MAG: hypothetical protein KME09_01075 [Pleurocapsa minor HA4230-MV1]|jgi:hypothetical protein|nr:hypothetical protein [Pleurocapsa minor HA4230-MV1]
MPLTQEEERDCKTKILNLIIQKNHRYREIDNFCGDYTPAEIVKCINQLVNENIIREEKLPYEHETSYYLISDNYLLFDSTYEITSSSDTFERYFNRIPLTLEQERDCKTKILNLIKQGRNHHRQVENFCDDFTVIEIVTCVNQLVGGNIIRQEGAYYHLN